MDFLGIGDRLAAVGRWIRRMLAGRADAEAADRERRRELLRGIVAAMAVVMREADKLGRYQPYDTVRLKTLEAELEVGRLSSEVSDERLGTLLTAFRRTVQPMVERNARARRPTDDALTQLRGQYDTVLARVAELQRDLG